MIGGYGFAAALSIFLSWVMVARAAKTKQPMGS